MLDMASPAKYTHFVPMGDTSQSIKKLLEIPESDNSPLKPVEGYQEVMNAEKETPSVTQEPVMDSKFKEEAKEYLNTPNVDREEGYVSAEVDKSIIAKNTANLANIVAASESIKSKPKPRRSKPKIVKPKTPVVKKKKSTTKVKKLTSFRILEKKKY